MVISLSLCLPLCLSLSLSFSVCLSVCLSLTLSVCLLSGQAWDKHAVARQQKGFSVCRLFQPFHSHEKFCKKHSFSSTCFFFYAKTTIFVFSRSLKNNMVVWLLASLKVWSVSSSVPTLQTSLLAFVAGYNGRHCEQRVDPCSSSPCYFGAQCSSNGGTFTCNCPAGCVDTVCSLWLSRCNFKESDLRLAKSSDGEVALPQK